MVCRPWGQWRQGLAILVGVGTREEARASSWLPPASLRESWSSSPAACEDGQTFKAYLPGGASGGILPASLADLPLDFGTLDKYGSFVGSHAIVVFSDVTIFPQW